MTSTISPLLADIIKNDSITILLLALAIVLMLGWIFVAIFDTYIEPYIRGARK